MSGEGFFFFFLLIAIVLVYWNFNPVRKIDLASDGTEGGQENAIDVRITAPAPRSAIGNDASQSITFYRALGTGAAVKILFKVSKKKKKTWR